MILPDYTAMNCNRKTFRSPKVRKSYDFARRKNDVEDKMLDTKLKVMEKEERTVRQKLYEIRREKYSRTFYKGPERPKFVDVNVCETEEDDSNKLNLITASGVERTKNCLRRKSIAVEELNPGQVVRVCVSSKLEDKVTGDETSTPSTSLPPIAKPAPSNKRRHSVAIVTNIEQHNKADLFTSVTSFMQSISEEGEGANICKDDLYFGRKTEEKYSETTFGERSGRNDGQTGDLVKVTCCSEKLRDLRPQSATVEEIEEKNRNDCSSYRKITHGCLQNVLGEDHDSSGKVSKPDVRKTETGQCNSPTSVPSSPKRRVKPIRRPNSDFSSSLRSQSSRTYSDSSLQERATFRKCITPLPVLSKSYSRMRSAETSAAMYEGAAMGHKSRIRSLSAGGEHQASVLTEKEAQMAEQVIIRQLEIKEMAKRMKKLSLQHFGDSKTMSKIPRKPSCSNSPYTRRRLEDRASHDTSNSTERVPTPEITRRHTHNPHLLKKIVKDHCKNDRGKTVMVKVLFELSGDMPDCRYLRCGDKASESKNRL